MKVSVKVPLLVNSKSLVEVAKSKYLQLQIIPTLLAPDKALWLYKYFQNN